MITVSFITFCHPPHLPLLHEAGELERMLTSHKHQFSEVIVVHQRCQGHVYRPFDTSGVRIVESENYPDIFAEYGIGDDPLADELTHGPGGKHFWRHHTINHFIGLKEAASDFIVFSDCDCYIKHSPDDRSWVAEGIDILQNHREVLIVSPGDGGDMHEAMIPQARLTRNVSQQLFLCERERFRGVDFNLPWDGEFDCVGGPFAEFYVMMEGRIWRWMREHGLWRAILPDRWRYWHNMY